MFFYGCAVCSSAVFGGGGGGEVPFDVGCSGDEGYIIQVINLA
jgi:hypothetical protein